MILCRWCANEARRIYGTLTETDADRDIRRLVEWIRSQGGATTAKQLQRSNSRKYPNSDAATLALEALAAARYGHWVDRPSDTKGGRPTRDFILLPTTDDTDETQGEGPACKGDLPTQAPDETPDALNKSPRISGEHEVSRRYRRKPVREARASNPAGKLLAHRQGFRRTPPVIS